MSYKSAIVEFCRHCIVDEYATGLGTWKQQIRDCTSSTCPLFNYRPGAEKPKTIKRKTLTPEHKQKLQQARQRKTKDV